MSKSKKKWGKSPVISRVSKMKKFTGKPTVTINETAQKHIDYLHKMVRRSTEWCGILAYRIIKGLDENNKINFQDPNDIEIEVTGIFPMEIGSSTYTEGNYAEHIPSMVELFDFNFMSDRCGYIHTHHTMGTFPSGVDDGDLEENAPRFEQQGYLSLIVNYAGNYSCRWAFPVKSQIYSGLVLNEYVGYFDCGVVPFQKDIEVSEAYAEVVKNLPENRVRVSEFAGKNTTVYGSYGGYGGNTYGLNGWTNKNTHNKPAKPANSRNLSQYGYWDHINKEWVSYDDKDEDDDPVTLFSNAVVNNEDDVIVVDNEDANLDDIVLDPLDTAFEKPDMISDDLGNSYRVVNVTNPIEDFVYSEELGMNVYVSDIPTVD